MPDTACATCGRAVAEGIPFCPHCGSRQPTPLSQEELQRDPYRTLQVAEDAEPEVIEAAYRGLARKYHPDTSTSSDSERRM
jgi:DnaJ-domain-containing protein 1